MMRLWGLGEIVVARQLGELAGQPGMKLGDQRRTQLPAYREALGGAPAVDRAFC